MSDFLNGKLDNQEIRKEILQHTYPSGYKPTIELVDSILDQFWFHDFYNSLLSDPKYLEVLIKYLTTEKPEHFSRFDYYRFLFSEIVQTDKERSALQLIALAFEQVQTDAMSPLDYEGLLKAVEVSKDMFSVSWMENNHLAKITDREGKKYFIWEHHTLTEFLVSEYILQFENPIDEFKKLVVLEKEKVVAFKPSWSGVLRFLLESPIKGDTINWIVPFLTKYKDNLDDNLSEILVFVSADTSSDIRKKIFNLIYNSYFERIVWLPVWARGRLSKFLDKESYLRLKTDIKKWSNLTETFVRRGNAVSVLEGLLENKSVVYQPRHVSS